MIPKIRSIHTIETAPAGINLLVVKVETTEPGLYGLGCATFTYRITTVKHLIDNYIAPLVIGKEVDKITDLWQLCHQNAYWRSGPIENNAISGIDMALWDIKGKMANMPLYQLLGGKVRAGVPIYTHADGNYPDEVIESVEAFRSIGLKYIRCQYGSYGGTPFGEIPKDAAKGALPGTYLDSREYMYNTIQLFEKLRLHFGNAMEFVHDVHERIHPAQAREFCHEMDPFHLFFLEDVVSPENIDWLREIHNYCTTPLSHRELDVNINEWKRPLIEKSIDFVRAHLSDIGGITPALKMAAFADLCGVRTCWHSPGDMSPVACAAVIHLDLASTNFGLQEWSGLYSYFKSSKPDDPLHEVFSGIPEYGLDGYVYANDKPGLGITINEEAAAKYPCQHTVTTWTQTRNKDGSLQTP